MTSAETGGLFGLAVQLMQLFSENTKDMCHLMATLGLSLDYTRHTMLQLDQEARKEIEKLGGNPILERVLDELKNW